MTTKDEALKQALDALGRVAGDDLQRWKKVADPGSIAWHVLRAIATCRAALAQKDEQHEPVAWMYRCIGETRFAERLETPGMHQTESVPLYTEPPKR